MTMTEGGAHAPLSSAAVRSSFVCDGPQDEREGGWGMGRLGWAVDGGFMGVLEGHMRGYKMAVRVRVWGTMVGLCEAWKVGVSLRGVGEGNTGVNLGH